ncbi:hypothetical protein OUZ56_015159 [Daphnia magna]|uniref:Uncharacterized protein n=1 Tax=Daphnia magna TaxID=35525 RepID=A0ABR0AM72_9CRUS|nr:hypothetical protein OUZ56_015159 [Daphnia magna]
MMNYEGKEFAIHVSMSFCKEVGSLTCFPTRFVGEEASTEMRRFHYFECALQFIVGAPVTNDNDSLGWAR